MLLILYHHCFLGRSAPTRVEIETERVRVDLDLGRQVREQRGTIIRNRVKNPTTNPTTFSATHKKVLFPNSSRGSND